MDQTSQSFRSIRAILSLCLIFLVIYHPVQSAPFLFGSIRSPKEKGCYYMLKHYKNGQQIQTNEPCLNCTCSNSMLMCYLRVCPFLRPLSENCTVNKIPGECCPQIVCSNVPDPEPELELSPDLEADPEPEARPRLSSMSTTLPTPDDSTGCYLNNKYYPEGTQLPINPLKSCEICYCIRNSSACVMQECALQVSGCSPVYARRTCCPVRYNCTSHAATTIPPDLRYTSKEVLGCYHEGKYYLDGEQIKSSNPCEHCYCMRNEVVCAIQECKAPCEGCVPIPEDDDQCCPRRYECAAPTTTSRPFKIVQPKFEKTTTPSDASFTKVADKETTTESVIELRKDEIRPIDCIEDENGQLPAKCIESTRKKLVYDMVTELTGAKDLTTEPTISEVTEEEKIELTSTPSSFLKKSSYSPGPRKEGDSEYFIRPSSKVPFGRKKPTPKPGSIPGEGICRFAGKIYQNGEKIDKDDPCLELCLCINSLILCDHVVCDPRPEEKLGTKCESIRISNQCCPEYKCYNLTEITTTTESQLSLTSTLPTTTTSTTLVTEKSEIPKDKETTSQSTLTTEISQTTKVIILTSDEPEIESTTQAVSIDFSTTDEHLIESSTTVPTTTIEDKLKTNFTVKIIKDVITTTEPSAISHTTEVFTTPMNIIDRDKIDNRSLEMESKVTSLISDQIVNDTVTTTTPEVIVTTEAEEEIKPNKSTTATRLDKDFKELITESVKIEEPKDYFTTEALKVNISIEYSTTPSASSTPKRAKEETETEFPLLTPSNVTLFEEELERQPSTEPSLTTEIPEEHSTTEGLKINISTEHLPILTDIGTTEPSTVFTVARNATTTRKIEEEEKIETTFPTTKAPTVPSTEELEKTILTEPSVDTKTTTELINETIPTDLVSTVPGIQTTKPKTKWTTISMLNETKSTSKIEPKLFKTVSPPAKPTTVTSFKDEVETQPSVTTEPFLTTEKTIEPIDAKIATDHALTQDKIRTTKPTTKWTALTIPNVTTITWNLEKETVETEAPSTEVTKIVLEEEELERKLSTEPFVTTEATTESVKESLVTDVQTAKPQTKWQIMVNDTTSSPKAVTESSKFVPSTESTEKVEELATTVYKTTPAPPIQIEKVTTPRVKVEVVTSSTITKADIDTTEEYSTTPLSILTETDYFIPAKESTVTFKEEVTTTRSLSTTKLPPCEPVTIIYHVTPKENITVSEHDVTTESPTREPETTSAFTTTSSKVKWKPIFLESSSTKSYEAGEKEEAFFTTISSKQDEMDVSTKKYSTSPSTTIEEKATPPSTTETTETPTKIAKGDELITGLIEFQNGLTTKEPELEEKETPTEEKDTLATGVIDFENGFDYKMYDTTPKSTLLDIFELNRTLITTTTETTVSKRKEEEEEEEKMKTTSFIKSFTVKDDERKPEVLLEPHEKAVTEPKTLKEEVTTLPDVTLPEEKKEKENVSTVFDIRTTESLPTVFGESTTTSRKDIELSTEEGIKKLPTTEPTITTASPTEYSTIEIIKDKTLTDHVTRITDIETTKWTTVAMLMDTTITTSASSTPKRAKEETETEFPLLTPSNVTLFEEELERQPSTEPSLTTEIPEEHSTTEGLKINISTEHLPILTDIGTTEPSTVFTVARNATTTRKIEEEEKIETTFPTTKAPTVPSTEELEKTILTEPSVDTKTTTELINETIPTDLVSTVPGIQTTKPKTKWTALTIPNVTTITWNLEKETVETEAPSTEVTKIVLEEEELERKLSTEPFVTTEAITDQVSTVRPTKHDTKWTTLTMFKDTATTSKAETEFLSTEPTTVISTEEDFERQPYTLPPVITEEPFVKSTTLEDISKTEIPPEYHEIGTTESEMVKEKVSTNESSALPLDIDLFTKTTSSIVFNLTETEEVSTLAPLNITTLKLKTTDHIPAVEETTGFSPEESSTPSTDLPGFIDEKSDSHVITSTTTLFDSKLKIETAYTPVEVFTSTSPAPIEVGISEFAVTSKLPKLEDKKELDTSMQDIITKMPSTKAKEDTTPYSILEETTDKIFLDQNVTLSTPSTESVLSTTMFSTIKSRIDDIIDMITTLSPLASTDLVSESTPKSEIGTSKAPISLSTAVEADQKEASTRRLDVSEEPKTAPSIGPTVFTETITLREMTTEAGIIDYTKLKHDFTEVTVKVNDSTTTDQPVKAETTEAEETLKSTTPIVPTTPKVTLKTEDVFKDNETSILDYSTTKIPLTEEDSFKSIISETEEIVTTPCAPVTEKSTSQAPKVYSVSPTTESSEELSTTKGLSEDGIEEIATTTLKMTLKEEILTQPVTTESSPINYTTLVPLLTDETKVTTISNLEEVTSLDEEATLTSTLKPHVTTSEVISTEPSTEAWLTRNISKIQPPTTEKTSTRLAAEDEEVTTQPTPITSEITLSEFSEVTVKDMSPTSSPQIELEVVTESILDQTTSSKEVKIKTLVTESLSTTESSFVENNISEPYSHSTTTDKDQIYVTKDREEGLSTEPTSSTKLPVTESSESVTFEEAVTETPSSVKVEIGPSTTGYLTEEEEEEEAIKTTSTRSTEKPLLNVTTEKTNRTWPISTTHKMSTFETFTTPIPLTDKSITITEDIELLPKSTTPESIEEHELELTTIPSKMFKTIDTVTKKILNFSEEITLHFTPTTEPMPTVKMDELEIDERKLVTEPVFTTSTKSSKAQDIGLSTKETTEVTSTPLPHTETISEYPDFSSTLPSQNVSQTEATSFKPDLFTHPSEEDVRVNFTIEDQTENFEITSPKFTLIPTITTLTSDLFIPNDTSKVTPSHFETTSYPTSPKAVDISEEPFTGLDLSTTHETTSSSTDYTLFAKISTLTPPTTETVVTINKTAQTVHDFILKDQSTTSQPYINITLTESKDEITEPSILTSPKVISTTPTEVHKDNITTEELVYKGVSTTEATSLAEETTEPPTETSTYLGSIVTEPFEEAVSKLIEVLNLTTINPIFTKVYKIDAFGLKENRTGEEEEEEAKNVTVVPKVDNITKTTMFTTLLDDSLSFVTERTPGAETSVTSSGEEATTLFSKILDAAIASIEPSSTDFEVTTLESSTLADTRNETISTTPIPSSLPPTRVTISDITNETIDYKKYNVTLEGDQDTGLIDKVWMTIKSIIKVGEEDNQTITTILPKIDEDKFVESTTTPLYPIDETKSTSSSKTEKPVYTSTPSVEDDFFGEIDHHEITEEDYETTLAPVESKNVSKAKPFYYGVKTHDFESQRKEVNKECVYKGQVYQSAEQIHRENACEFCFCYKGEIICLEQVCPPPVPNCQATHIKGFCCPRYHCPIEIAKINVTTSTTTTTTTTTSTPLAAINSTQVTGCHVNGEFYKLGELVKPASGPCLECRCQIDGFMKCNPKECQPEKPLLLKMNPNLFSKR